MINRSYKSHAGIDAFKRLSKTHGLIEFPYKSTAVHKKKFPHSELYDEVMNLLFTYGTKPWKTNEGVWYSGLGLTYDRFNSISKIEQVLGDKDNPYYDQAMLFNTIIPEAKKLFEILNIPLTPIRSRIAIIDGSYEFGRSDGWHVDESPYENLRINIPIATTPDFMFQLEDNMPEHFEEGWGYWWDTSIPHRVFSKNKNNFKRIHLVLGFSPWFVLNNNEWMPNEYFNKIHPLEII